MKVSLTSLQLYSYALDAIGPYGKEKNFLMGSAIEHRFLDLPARNLSTKLLRNYESILITFDE
jgi:hypothetical protein